MKTRAKSKKKDQTTSSFLPQNSLTDGAPSSKTKIETPAPATIQNPNPQKVKVQNQRQALPKKQQNTACLTRTANSISSSTEADRTSTKADRETTKAYDDEVSKRYNTRSRANPPTSSSTKVASITPNLEIQHAAKQDSIVPSTSAELSTSSSTNSTIPEASPTSSDRVTLTTFHLFKKLANELKTMIVSIFAFIGISSRKFVLFKLPKSVSCYQIFGSNFLQKPKKKTSLTSCSGLRLGWNVRNPCISDLHRLGNPLRYKVSVFYAGNSTREMDHIAFPVDK